VLVLELTTRLFHLFDIFV